MTRPWIYAGSIILLIALFATYYELGFFHPLGPSDQPHLKVCAVLIEVPGGWGYEIYHHDRRIIRQEYMPVKQGFAPFPCPLNAQSAGDWVAERLQDGRSPHMTPYVLSHFPVCPETIPHETICK